MNSSRILLILLAILFALSPASAAAQPPKTIPRTAVESSNLKSVGYHARSRTLEVEFNHGGVYRYFAVPAETHAALMKSESKGKFFSANIRGKFRFERLDKAK